MHIERGLKYCKLPVARLKHKQRSSARLHFISVSGCVLRYVCKLNLSSWLVAQSRRMQKVIYRNLERIPPATETESFSTSELLHSLLYSCSYLHAVIYTRTHEITCCTSNIKAGRQTNLIIFKTWNLLLYRVPSKTRPIKRSHILIVDWQ